MQDLRERMHVSRNRLEGSLNDTSIDRILDACHRHLVTGTVHVRAFAAKGEIELRAGAVDEACYGDDTGKAAIERMRKLTDGEYELVQRLPDLDGELGDTAQLEGDSKGLSLITLMRHCEHNALTCTIAVINDFDRGEVVYRAGEIVEVSLNGERDEDAIVELIRFPEAKFRVSAQPLDLDIDGWPSVGREPTAPFKVEVEHTSPPVSDGEPPDASPAAEPTDRRSTAPSAMQSVVAFGIGAAAGLAALGLMYVVALLLM